MDVAFDRVGKRFGETVALEDFTLTVAAGELICLLGPSGCGKTTALRALAGFVAPDVGDVRVGGRSLLGVPARERGFGMVFQSYSLFPNMTARRNVEFALELRGVGRATRRTRADELLELTHLGGLADRYPHEMSGGQQQRVALARALATDPTVLLLDEPLSALDASVREQLRGEIRRIQREFGTTTLFVTHDQVEAMAIADRIAVMRDGRVVQEGPPAAVYSRPVDGFVAGFLGTANDFTVEVGDRGEASVLGTHVEGVSPGQRVHVRPEHLMLVPAGTDGSDGPVEVLEVAFLGALTRVDVRHRDAVVILYLPSSAAAGLSVGSEARLRLNGAALVLDAVPSSTTTGASSVERP